MRIVLLVLSLAFTWANTAAGQERAFGLHAPQALVETGLVRFMVPRFALKNATRVNLLDTPEGADMVLALGGEGKPVFAGPEGTWNAALVTDNSHAANFLDWMRSDVGRRTIDGFAGADGTNPYNSEVKVAVAVAEVTFDGDPELGREVSMTKCGRCHKVDARKMGGIGSTPSFAVLRSFADWEDRFSVFYILKPHAAFTQVAEVTPPFDQSRPSPIAPVELTLDEVEAILAFVAAMAPADLGQPLQLQ